MKAILPGLSKLSVGIFITLSILACQVIAEDQPKPQDTTKSAVDSSAATGSMYRQAGTSHRQAPARRVVSKPDQSVIVMTFPYYARLSVVDPEGRMTGIDPATGESRQEIPKSAYYDESIGDLESDAVMLSMNLDIMEPTSGEYNVTLVGVQDENYEFSIHTYDTESKSSGCGFHPVPIGPDEVHSFLLSYDKVNSMHSIVTGGFEGTESIAPEINRFLSYVNISGPTTRFPSGTDSISLFVIYSRDLITEQFAATLNGENVSALFTPVDGKYELVDIPLHAGENLLVLSAFGFTDEAIETDTDSLVFVVE